MLRFCMAAFLCFVFLSNPSFTKEYTSSDRDSFALGAPATLCRSGKMQVELHWNTATGAASYAVERRRAGRLRWEVVATLRAPATAFADSSLAGENGVYLYRSVVHLHDRTQRSNVRRVRLRRCVTANLPRSSSSSSSVMSSAPASGMLWGAYAGDRVTDAAALEAIVGARMDIQAVFVGAGDPFPSAFGPTVRDQGKTLAIFWEPWGVSLDDIIAGGLDADIDRFVAGARGYDGPVIFLPFHEMNGDWDAWGGTVGSNTPAKLIAAWKHVHDRFTNVPRVKFGWAVNSDSVPDTQENRIDAYYPGDAYVDYVGADGFNFGDPWLSFDQVFGDALRQIAAYKKPIYIFSMATAAGPDKAAWITDALRQMSEHPLLAGWIWFNQNKERDWRIHSDEAALRAFRSALRPLAPSVPERR